MRMRLGWKRNWQSCKKRSITLHRSINYRRRWNKRRVKRMPNSLDLARVYKTSQPQPKSNRHHTFHCPSANNNKNKPHSKKPNKNHQHPPTRPYKDKRPTNKLVNKSPTKSHITPSRRRNQSMSLCSWNLMWRERSMRKRLNNIRMKRRVGMCRCSLIDRICCTFITFTNNMSTFKWIFSHLQC